VVGDGLGEGQLTQTTINHLWKSKQAVAGIDTQHKWPATRGTMVAIDDGGHWRLTVAMNGSNSGGSGGSQ
jgi:hypothetical protein